MTRIQDGEGRLGAPRGLAFVAAIVALGSSALAQAQSGAAPDPQRHLSPAELDALAARFDHEPRVAEVVHDALTYYERGGAEPEQAARRARLSALMPEVRLRARRGRARDANETQTGTRLSTDDDAVLEGTLIFHLPRALYSGDEASWSREARAQAAARVQLVRLVVSLYFERRRLQLEQLMGAYDLESVVRIAELTALLDSLTDGRFGERLRESREARDPP